MKNQVFKSILLLQSKHGPNKVALLQVIIHKITANQICLNMSSAGLSPILPIFCDVCAQDFNSVDTAVTHFTFKKHWTVRNSCVKPAIFIPGKTFKVPIFQGYFIVVAIF